MGAHQQPGHVGVVVARDPGRSRHCRAGREPHLPATVGREHRSSRSRIDNDPANSPCRRGPSELTGCPLARLARLALRSARIGLDLARAVRAWGWDLLLLRVWIAAHRKHAGRVSLRDVTSEREGWTHLPGTGREPWCVLKPRPSHCERPYSSGLSGAGLSGGGSLQFILGLGVPCAGSVP